MVWQSWRAATGSGGRGEDLKGDVLIVSGVKADVIPDAEIGGALEFELVSGGGVPVKKDT